MGIKYPACCRVADLVIQNDRDDLEDIEEIFTIDGLVDEAGME